MTTTITTADRIQIRLDEFNEAAIHEACNLTSRKARALAPNVYEDTMDAGCTNLSQWATLGPRQRRAFLWVVAGYVLNHVSDPTDRRTLDEGMKAYIPTVDVWGEVEELVLQALIQAVK